MPGDEDDDDFLDEDPDLDYDELGFQQVAFKVRSLSYAIWTTGQHQFCEDAPTLNPCAHDPGRPSMMAIFRAFATLLTRDSRSQLVAVTGDGPPSAQSTRVFALVPTEPHSLGPSEDLVACSLLSYADIRHSDSAALPAFLLQSPCQVTDVEHAEHILQIISVSRHAVGERRTRILQLALQYTVHQCWTEVTTRFMASNYIFAGPPLVDVLRGWEPAVEDQRYLPPLANVSITWLPVENEAAASRLKKTDVPVHPHAPNTFLFDWSTVQGWLQTLVDTLAILMDSVNRADVKQVAANLPVLHFLLRSSAIAQIFRLPSLQSYFASFSEPRHERSRLQDRLGYTIIDDERRECEGSGDHVLRYLMSLTSWYYAITTLADAYTPGEISLPVLRLVFCSLPRPSQPEYCHGKVLAPRLTVDTNYVMDNFQSRDDELLRQHLPDLSDKMFPLDQKKFSNIRDGTHTEALLMDFVAQACKSQEGQHYEIFTPCHSLRIIGIPIQHTMCYCCNFLESILFNRQRHIETLGASITDPMRFSHAFPGHLQPWTPPRLLSNSAALDGAYGALCQLFAEVIRAYSGDRTPTATPHTELRSLCLRLEESSSSPQQTFRAG